MTWLRNSQRWLCFSTARLRLGGRGLLGLLGDPETFVLVIHGQLAVLLQQFVRFLIGGCQRIVGRLIIRQGKQEQLASLALNPNASRRRFRQSARWGSTSNQVRQYNPAVISCCGNRSSKKVRPCRRHGRRFIAVVRLSVQPTQIRGEHFGIAMPLQDLSVGYVNARRFNLSGNHRFGLPEIVLVMRTALAKGQHKGHGIGAPTCPPSPLKIVDRARRHVPQDDGL